MGSTKRASINLLGGIILVFIGISFRSMVFGELPLPSLEEERIKQDELSPKNNRPNGVPLQSGFGGLRSEESEREQATAHRSSPLQSLNTEDQDLVEVIDAGGGTMINLQGRFQSGLKVSEESQETSVEKSIVSVLP